jgi:hypothetical protein
MAGTSESFVCAVASESGRSLGPTVYGGDSKDIGEKADAFSAQFTIFLFERLFAFG